MKSLFALLTICLAPALNAQVGIGTTIVNESALLQLNSTNKGFLPPRMNSSSRNAIVSPTEGLMVYDISTHSYWYFNNGTWIELAPVNNVAYKIPADRINPSGAAGDRFGSAVSIGSSGNYALVGAPGDNAGAGSCFMLNTSFNNLWYMNSMTPYGLEAGDACGYSVAIDRFNNGIDGVAGAPFDDSSTVSDMGCAYFLNGVVQKKVYAPVASRIAGAKFGRSVDIASNSIYDNGYGIVGAPGANGGKGAAFIYQYNPNTLQWEHKASLTDDLGSIADSFGVSVSIYFSFSGDSAWAFVGAPYDDDGVGFEVGSVTAFRKAAGSKNWIKAGKFFPATQYEDKHFGYAISNVMQCNKIIVGAPGKSSGKGILYQADLTALNAGAGVFTLSTIPNSSLLNASTSLGLGFTLSIMENGNDCTDYYLLAGCQSGQANIEPNFGTARLLRSRNGNWSTVDSYITDPYLQATAYGFGQAVSISTGTRTMLIGAPLQKVDGNVQQGKIQFVKF